MTPVDAGARQIPHPLLIASDFGGSLKSHSTRRNFKVVWPESVKANSRISMVGGLRCAGFLFLVLGLLLPVQATQARPRKLRVSDPALAAELRAHGARVLADYGSFQLLESAASPALAAPAASRVQALEDADFIELNAGRLDTRVAEVVAKRSAVGSFTGHKLHLVQFVGPIKAEWREALDATGVAVVHYVPQNAYLIRGDAAALARLQTWAQSVDFLQWDGDYASDYKLHPSVRSASPATTNWYAVQLVADATANAETLALVDQLKAEPVKQQYQILNYLNLVVRLPAARVAELAARPEVVSIRPYVEHKRRDERQDQIMAGNLTGMLPNGPGYLAWLASKGFTQEQFNASGFVVDISDSGLDNGTTAPGHFGLYQSGNAASNSRVAYARLEGTPNSGSTIAGCDGHGNINGHIIGGFNDLSSAPHLDSAGYHYGLGVCPFVKVGSSVLFDPAYWTDPIYPDLQSRAYADGARISNNSWGASTAGDYDSDAQAYDALVRDAQPSGAAVATPGNQPMVILFAAGNDGPSASTVGSPGTAKNVIVVGAAENVHSHSTANGGSTSTGSDGCDTLDSEADSAGDIASFSSRGPCTDGRQKPDLVAPGTHVTGGVAQSVLTTAGTGSAISCFDATGVCALTTGNFFPVGQEFYTTSSGTSHSTPGVAGACALLRQYFINASLPAPSPAMTKAFLVNAARYLSGTYAGDSLPSPSQGMGAVNLGTAFDGVARVLRDQLTAEKFTASGQTRIVSGSVVDSGKPFRVTLAWTDAPGSTTGNAYNNDLDLEVTVGGQTYVGNAFSGGASVTGGAADAKNNLESVFLPAGVSGGFVVTVRAANINSDGVPSEAPTLDQDFALVIYNGTETAAPVITTPPQSQAVSLGAPVNFTVGVSSATTPAYQWYFGTAPIGDATNSSYSISSALEGDSGAYWVVVTNVYGSTTSSVANLSVVVAPLITANPASLTVVTGSPAGFSVTALGASPLAYQWQFDGSNIVGATASAYNIPAAQLADAGSYSVVVSNYAGSVTSAPAVLNVATWSAQGVVISQLYGGGGSSGAIYQNDYVELFNAGGVAVDLSTWSLQYASAAGTTWSVTTLTGSIQPGAFYLIRLGSNGSSGSQLPSADRTNTAVNISSANGKVALVTNQTMLAGANPLSGGTIKDFVGYGSAGAYEGAAAAPAGAVALAVLRKDNGTVDTDNNSADFVTGTPSPHSSAVIIQTIDLAVQVSHASSFAQGDVAANYTIVVTNQGSLATAGTVTVSNALPDGLVATSFTGAGWTTTLVPLTATRTDSLAAGLAFPALTLTVSVATNAPAWVTNVVTVTTTGDTNSVNNIASDATAISSTGGGSFSGVLVGWNVRGVTSFGVSPMAPTTKAANLTAIGLTRAAGVATNTTPATGGWGGAGFTSTTEAAAITAADYATFSLAANAGYRVSLGSVSRFDYRRSGSGPPTGVLQYQIGSGSFVSFATNAYTSTSTSGASLAAIDLTSIAALQNIGPGTNVTIRIVNYGATGATGTWYIYDQAASTADDFAITGNLTPLTGPAPSAPNLTLLTLSGGQVQFTLTGTAGTNYVVEMTPSLEAGAWSPIHTGAAPILFTEPATNAQRFYRGKLWP